jgi:gamma-glutamyl:cysteine ligase YbdK (ATP-grasp superfamily)
LAPGSQPEPRRFKLFANSFSVEIFLPSATYAAACGQVEFKSRAPHNRLARGGTTTGALQRRVGLEQEFFLVEESGLPSDRSDEFVQLCQDISEREPCVAPEFVQGLVEINTRPVGTFTELEHEYVENLRLALRAARLLGVRLYPLGPYPLPIQPVMREELDYLVQVRTVGAERFVHAGRCAGTHLHLELPKGTVDPSAGIAPGAPEEARMEALNLYNLATALDPALISLTRSCPFYEGETTGLASRVVRYRGSEAFGWDGVYRDLPLVGALLPYATDIEQLVRQQHDRYRAWLRAMDEAGVERRLFFEAGGDLLRPAWNPVRLNRHGTVELRGMDSNYPEITLTAAALIVGAASRLRRDALSVVPDDGVRAFEVDGEKLRVPGFGYLGRDLLFAAVTGGVYDPAVSAYVDSVVEFVAGEEARLAGLQRHRRSSGAYPSTEADLLEVYSSEDGGLPTEEGLRLVLAACDELEAQASSLSGDPADAL